MLVTDHYRSVLEKEHAQGEWGIMSLHFAARVANMMKLHRSKEVLDYGCGAGNLGKSLKVIMPDVIVHNYEPGIPQYSHPPAPCKIVACIDVLEHVEPECLESVLNDLERVIEGYAVITVSCHLAMRVLNNGWNAHICIKTPQEWLEILRERFDITFYHAASDFLKLEVAKKGLINENQRA